MPDPAEVGRQAALGDGGLGRGVGPRRKEQGDRGGAEQERLQFAPVEQQEMQAWMPITIQPKYWV